MPPPTYYKFLTADNRGPYSNFEWSVPSGDKPGKWLHTKGPLELCVNGIHVCEFQNLLVWADAQLFEVEVNGEGIVGDNKTVFQSARLVRKVETWNDRTTRLFAADCAEHVAHLWKAPAGVTWKPADTIDVVRRFANGEATRDELAAASDAAWAASDAAWVSSDAAWAASDAAWDAASDAASDAAWAAARDAASDAAWDAERQWQLETLAKYLEVTP